jgi:hypothetical protein
MEIRKRKLNFANRKLIGGNGNENRTALSGETDTEMEFPFPANMEFRFRFDVHGSIQQSRRQAKLLKRLIPKLATMKYLHALEEASR